MIDRVFDGAEVPCLCLFESPSGDRVRARVLKISKSKAVLDSAVEMDAGITVAVQLRFGDGTELDLEAEVHAPPGPGVYLTWKHADANAAGRLQVLLVQQSGAPPPVEEAAPAPTPAGEGYLGSLLSKTRQVDSQSLAAQHRQLRVVGMSDITRLIEESVAEALTKSEHAWTEKEREKLLNEAQDVFQERLDEMRAQRADSEARAAKLEEQLRNAESLLEEERQRVLSRDQFTVSDAGMNEIEGRMERLLQRIVRDRQVDSEIEHEMRGFVSRMLDDERGKILEKEQSAQNDSIRLLEHKVQRLAKALEETSDERDRANRRAAALEAHGGGVAGMVYAAGLGDEDPAKERKLMLLEDLVKENRDVRAAMGQPTTPVSEAADTAPPVNTAPDATATPEASPPPVPVAASAASTSESSEAGAGGVKKISVRRVAPPPLERT